MRTRSNKMNIEWLYARQCWSALVAGEELPPVPKHQIFNIEENTGKTTLAREVPITPMPITYQGVRYFGS